jgi:hypothetical protein
MKLCGTGGDFLKRGSREINLDTSREILNKTKIVKREKITPTSRRMTCQGMTFYESFFGKRASTVSSGSKRNR